jgi:hypothetical protein
LDCVVKVVGKAEDIVNLEVFLVKVESNEVEKTCAE